MIVYKACKQMRNEDLIFKKNNLFSICSTSCDQTWILLNWVKVLLWCMHSNIYLATICFTWHIILSSRKSYGNVFVHMLNNATNRSSGSSSGTFNKSLPSKSCGRIKRRDDRRKENTNSWNNGMTFIVDYITTRLGKTMTEPCPNLQYDLVEGDQLTSLVVQILCCHQDTLHLPYPLLYSVK